MNILTFVVMVSVGIISLALAIDFGSEIVAEKRERRQLENFQILPSPAPEPFFSPDETMELLLFVIEKPAVKHSHRKVA
jgi:hypothetical protein